MVDFIILVGLLGLAFGSGYGFGHTSRDAEIRKLNEDLVIVRNKLARLTDRDAFGRYVKRER